MNLLITAIWLMLPAYLPNNCAAIFGGGTPIDRGRNFYDNRRIFGNGKTYRGTVAGIVCGILAGAAQNAVAPSLGLPSFGDGIVALTVIIGLSAGAMLGDLVASFFKRRLGLERGAALFLVDQLDFVFGCWALLLILAPGWFLTNFTPPILLSVIVITPVLHRITNIIGYRIGAKKEPW